MTVLELARKTGLPPAVVRFYSRTGALHAHQLPSGRNGYDAADAVRLRLVVELHRAGINLTGQAGRKSADGPS